MTTESADHCMLVNEWAWLRPLKWTWIEFFESEFGQKWRYGVLKAF